MSDTLNFLKMVITVIPIIYLVGFVVVTTSLSIFISFLMGKSDLDTEGEQVATFLGLTFSEMFEDVREKAIMMSTFPCVMSFFCNSTEIYDTEHLKDIFLSFAKDAENLNLHHVRIVGKNGSEILRIDVNHTNHPEISSKLYDVSKKKYHQDFLSNKSLEEVYFGRWSTHGPTHNDSWYTYTGDDLDGDHQPGHAEYFPYPSLLKAQKSIVCEDRSVKAYIILNVRMVVHLEELHALTTLGNLLIIDDQFEYMFNNVDRSKEFQTLTGKVPTFEKDVGSGSKSIIEEFNRSGERSISFTTINYHLSCIKIEGGEYKYNLCVSKTIFDIFLTNPFAIIVGISLELLLFLFIFALLILVNSQRKIKRQKKMLKRFSGIKDVEIILEEQRVEPEFKIAEHLFNHNKYFNVPYDHINLIKKIGFGATSTVYLATFNGEKVALKLLNAAIFDEKKIVQFEREANLLRKIDFPNVIKFHGCTINVKKNRIGSVMEYCENGSIRKYIHYHNQSSQGNVFELKEKLRLVLEITRAMEYLHNHSILHRDLKTDNIFLSDNMEAKVADFGLSRIIRDFNKTNTFYLGTSYYMAPEIVLGDNKYTAKVDCFSLAMVIFEIVFEDIEPFKTEHFIEFKIAHHPEYRPKIKEDAAKKMGIPDWVIELIKALWAHDPIERPSMDETVEIIEQHFKVEEEEEGENETVIDEEWEKHLGDKGMRKIDSLTSIKNFFYSIANSKYAKEAKDMFVSSQLSKNGNASKNLNLKDIKRNVSNQKVNSSPNSPREIKGTFAVEKKKTSPIRERLGERRRNFQNKKFENEEKSGDAKKRSVLNVISCVSDDGADVNSQKPGEKRVTAFSKLNLLDRPKEEKIGEKSVSAVEVMQMFEQTGSSTTIDESGSEETYDSEEDEEKMDEEEKSESGGETEDDEDSEEEGEGDERKIIV